MEPGLVGMTETHLRDAPQMEGSEYVMVGKGRRKQETFGGGRVEELDGGESVESDMLAVRVV